MSITVPAVPRRFRMERDADPSGISGTGCVADGVVWSDGTVALRWGTQWRTSAQYESISDVEQIHGHDGATRFVFLDDVVTGETEPTKDV